MSQSPDDPLELSEQDAHLADLLEACLRAELAAPGSADDLLRQAPEDLRDQLSQLVALAQVLHSIEWPSATPEFRARTRARFFDTPPRHQRMGPRRVVPWLVRVGVAAAVLVAASYASVLASANALPGQPLYPAKRADEAITLGLTRDDVSRAFVLLQHAGRRLDEASRLVGMGQVQPAGDLLQQYASTLERATASLSRARGAGEARRAEFEARLEAQRTQLDSLGRMAPPPLRASIQQAQAVATQELAQAEGVSVAGAVAPSPTASPVLQPEVSPSPAASPSTGAPARSSASPSPSPGR